MEFIIEVIFETILDSVSELWTNFMKKRNPDYDTNRNKKILSKIVAVLLIFATTILIFGILFLIEWKNPDLFNIVGFD